MLEVARAELSVVVCAATPEALDALAAADGLVLRIAPDEALVVGPPGTAEAIVAGAASVTEADPDALTLDATDGWTAWRLAGPDARLAFARLSALRLSDEPWVQGRVAGVPAKAIVSADAVDVLVPAMWCEHVGALARTTCSDLELRVLDEPLAWRRPAGETAAR